MRFVLIDRIVDVQPGRSRLSGKQYVFESRPVPGCGEEPLARGGVPERSLSRLSGDAWSLDAGSTDSSGCVADP